MEVKLTMLSLLIGTIISLSYLSEKWHVDWELVSRSWRSRIWRGELRPALVKSEENPENQ